MAKPLVVDRASSDFLIGKAIADVRAKKAAVQQDFDRTLGDTYEEYLQEIKRIRSDLRRYAEYVFGFKLEAHHLYLVQILQDLVDNKLPYRKVVFIAPPNSAKSTYTSVIFPTWYLGNNPDKSLLFLTSSDPMSVQFGNTVKGIFEEDEKFHRVFDDPFVRPDPRRGWSSNGLYLKGADRHKKDPTYRSAGWHASIMGGRADGLIIDDPLNQEAAQSATEQESAKEYHDMTVKMRLALPSEQSNYEGWEFLICTRWMENDLPEHCKNRGDFLYINLPVRAIRHDPDNPNSVPDPLGRQEGERLWPSRYTEEFLKAEENSLTPAKFNCVYMGDPISMGGEVFSSASWIQDLPSDFFIKRDDGKSTYDRLPKIQAYDTAFSERDTACYSVGGTACVDDDLNLYIVNVTRERLSTESFVDRVVKEGKQHRPVACAIEEAAFRHRIVRACIYAIKRKVNLYVYGVPQTQDKIARARLFAGRAEGGKVYADKRAPWYPPFIRELLGFPKTAFKDQVDMASLLGSMVTDFEMKQSRKKKKVKYALNRS